MSRKDTTKAILDILMSLHYIEESLLDISEKEYEGSSDEIEAALDSVESPPLKSLEEIQVTLDHIEDSVRCLLLDKGFKSAADVAQYQQYIYPKKD